MSGFLLCWHRAGGTLDPAVLARVRARLRARGPEGARTVEAPRAVAVHAAFTDAVGAADGLPILADEWLVAGDLRLDDRVHLRARLRDAGVEPPPERGDAWLLHAALRAWGEEAASQLMGDFAFAALDLRRGALVAARGTFGVKPLFVAETAAFVAVSNDIDALLALPGVDGSPDERALVDFLRAGSIVAPERTARRGVTRVPASHERRWEVDRAHAVRRHWRFPVPAARVGSRDDEVLEGFREVLGAAVRDRLRTPNVTIQLSGGLDSPAIAAMARAVAPEVALAAHTVSHERLVASDEREFAERVARHLGLPQEVSFIEGQGILAHLDEPGLRTAEPVADPELAEWRSRARRLASQAPVTIDGEDGDSLLAPPDLITLLRTRPVGETAAAYRRYRAESGRRPWLGLREWSPFRARRLARGWAAPAWLRADVRARHGEAVPDEPPPHPLRPRAAWSHQQPVWETLFAIDDPSVTGVPLTVVLPLLDARLFAFVFSVAPIPWCQEKALLRRAMEGRLPADVLARPKTPVHGAHEASIAVWRAAGGAERALPHPMDDLVDIDAWRRTLRESSAPDAVMGAWRVFEVARWLAQPGPADG